jgi:hypothetical protein
MLHGTQRLLDTKISIGVYSQDSNFPITQRSAAGHV